MHRLIALPLALLLAGPAAADRKATAPAGPAKTIARFLDEQTVGVVRVDLTKIDLDALLARVDKAGKLDKEVVAHIKGEAGKALAALKEAGVRDLYLVVRLEGIPGGPWAFVVAPLAPGAEAEPVSKALHEILHLRTQRLGDAVVAGQPSALRRVKDFKPAPVPELAKAFAAAGDGAVQAVGLLPWSLRRAVEETLPSLPPEVGGGPTKTVTRGLSWVALGVALKPKVDVRLTLQAADAEAARGIARVYQRALGGLSQAAFRDRDARAVFKSVDALKELLAPKVNDARITVVLDERELTSILLPAITKVQTAARRSESANNLKQMALAMYNYFDTNRAFPTHAIYSKDGKPLLSWRVAILPYVEANNLYQQFHLDEPWDSPHNKKLIAQMPPVFRDPASKAPPGKTVYLVPVGKDTMFPPGPKGIRFPADVTDGTSNTLLIVEADDDHAVTWTRPEDLRYDPKQPMKGLAGRATGHFLAAYADGSVHTISRAITAATLRALFTRNGGEVLGPDAP